MTHGNVQSKRHKRQIKKIMNNRTVCLGGEIEVLQQEENNDDSSLNTAIGEHSAQE